MFLEPQLIIFAIIILGVICVYVFYLLNLQNLLKEVSPQNREVPPANVWLMFIPIFSLIYPFILYPKISESVRKEFSSRNSRVSSDFGRSLGISMGLLGIVALVPTIGTLAGLANLVLLIVYWVKAAEFKNHLISLPKNSVGISNRADLLD